MNIGDSLKQLKPKLNKKFKVLKHFISTYLAEIFLLIGAFLFAYATYRVNFTAFIFVISFYFLGVGVFNAMTRR